MKKVFFACSMRGSFDAVDQKTLQQLPVALEELGLELMSKHQTQEGIVEQENQTTNTFIHDRDYKWLEDCDFVVAEISNPSLGVGGEIADAANLGKPVLGVYQLDEDKISAYIRGKLEGYDKGRHTKYKDINEFKKIVNTEGHDVEELMRAFNELRNGFLVIAVLLVVDIILQTAIAIDLFRA